MKLRCLWMLCPVINYLFTNQALLGVFIYHNLYPNDKLFAIKVDTVWKNDTVTVNGIYKESVQAKILIYSFLNIRF